MISVIAVKPIAIEIGLDKEISSPAKKKAGNLEGDNNTTVVIDESK